MSDTSHEVTRLLDRIREGSAEARDELVTLLYDRLRQRARARLRHERPDHTLGATDLTDEVLLRLLKGDEVVRAADGNQLFRAFARKVRQVLIDHARRRNAGVHGGGRGREELDDFLEDVRGRGRGEVGPRADVIDLHDALDALARESDHGGRVAGVLEMRFFGGLDVAEVAEAVGVAKSTAERDIRFGLAWLRDHLSREGGS